MTYLPRIVDSELKSRLTSAGAIVIEGTRACGKTETARQVARSAVLLDTDRRSRELFALDPGLLLDGATPRLIDEWQIEPEIWNHVRRAVDDRREPGQFILTGSAVPVDDRARHSGAGRFSQLRMRPMSLSEMGASSGAISLKALLEGEPARSQQPDLSIRDLAGVIIKGGWPSLSADATEDVSRRFVADYLNQIRRVDIRAPDGVTHDPGKVGALLTSLARGSASEVSVSTLSADAGGAAGPLSRDTTSSYLEALERIFVLVNQPAWSPHVRSRAALRKAPKRHLVDPSLAAAALGLGADRLITDPETFGLLFESLVYRDLEVYGQALDARLAHYRDSTGLEVDAVIELPGERWGAFEIKLSPAGIDAGAESLHRFADRIDTQRTGRPEVLGVITGTGYGYVRDDGIAVIPIGALGP